MANYYNRYKRLNNDSGVVSPPFIKLTEKSSDQMVIYNTGKTRLDKLSQDYYGVPYYSWLILLANPEFGGLEWNIKEGQAVRIPLPLNETLNEYEVKIRQRLDYYGE
jgi:hypothetical protein